MQPPSQEPPTQPEGFPPIRPAKEHHWYRPRNAAIGALVVIIGIGAAAYAAGGGKSSTQSPAPHNYNTPAAATTSAAPAPTAKPDGTFQGSCDYTLGSDPVGGTAEAIGDIQADNTGNVGIVVKVTISWPQEGYGSLKMSRTVRLGYGGSQDVQFHRHLTQTELDRLQSYQLGHDDNGCKYNGEMTDTFGAVHS